MASLFHSTCPSCGAPVQWASSASLMVVCGYCQSTLHKTGDALEKVGQVGQALEDYTPLQIGSSGVWQGVSFTLVGRIQLRYDRGLWNEWYALQDDGQGAWLSDANGQYTYTVDWNRTVLPDVQTAAGASSNSSGGNAASPYASSAQPKVRVPDFADLSAGTPWVWRQQVFLVADLRVATCVTAVGELPFIAQTGWQTQVADLRGAEKFVTFDYGMTQADKGRGIVSQSAPDLAVYVGKAVDLSQLSMQLLRDADQIKDSAGKLRGQLSSLTCPECSSAIPFCLGQTPFVHCPACHSPLQVQGTQALLQAAGQRSQQRSTSLKLGFTCQYEGRAYELIGLLVRQSQDEGEVFEWTEYLLFSSQKGFLWLVESDGKWQLSRAMDVWPTVQANDAKQGAPIRVQIGKTIYRQKEAYVSTVVFAAGAFNWQVQVGDGVLVTEYTNALTTLACEVDAHEMTWSMSSAVPRDLAQSIRQATGIQQTVRPTTAKSAANGGLWDWWITGYFATVSMRSLATLGLLNVIPLLAASAFMPAVIAGLIIYGVQRGLEEYDADDDEDTAKPLFGIFAAVAVVVGTLLNWGSMDSSDSSGGSSFSGRSGGWSMGGHK